MTIISSCASKLNNLTDQELQQMEIEWEKQGKSPSRKRYLRYYYRHREKYLIRKVLFKRNGRGETTSRQAVPDEFVERVEIKSGLII